MFKKQTDVLKEWFDRDYSGWQVYGRLWQRVKKYRLLLLAGILSGMFVGGAWLPIFQIMQPTIMLMQNGRVSSSNAAELPATPEAVSTDMPATETPKKEKASSIEKAPDWLKGIEKVAKYFGIEIVDKKGQIKPIFFLMVGLTVPIILFLRLAVLYLNGYILQWVGMKAVFDLRADIFRHLQSQSLSFFGRMNVGRLMTRCMSDPGTVQMLIAGTCIELCTAPFEIAVALGFVVYFAVQNGMVEIILLAILGYVLTIWPLTIIGKKLHGYVMEGLQRTSILSSNMLENLTGIRVVKAFHTEADETVKFVETNRLCMEISLRGLRLTLAIPPLMEAVTISLSILLLAICFWKQKTLAEIVPLMVPLIIAYRPLKTLGRVHIAIETARASLNRIFAFLDVDTSLPEAAHPIAKTTFDKDIVFQGVNFFYPANERQIIRDANFTLERGKTIAVVGSTGSGKTTIANLLARFYDPTSGSIQMDGVDLRDIAIADLRKLIGVVTQETILFNTDIAANIAYGTKGATREQIEMAAQMANAHDFIVNSEGGYERLVGDKGFVLSGGERQRIAIARAILKNPPILILDEATSALDTVTEQQVQEALSRLMQNRTVFVIAHRLSTVRHADTILVMNQGEIIERGHHNELYAQGGVYRNLCDVQKQIVD